MSNTSARQKLSIGRRVEPRQIEPRQKEIQPVATSNNVHHLQSIAQRQMETKPQHVAAKPAETRQERPAETRAPKEDFVDMIRSISSSLDLSIEETRAAAAFGRKLLGK